MSKESNQVVPYEDAFMPNIPNILEVNSDS